MIEGHGIKPLTQALHPKRMLILSAQSTMDGDKSGHRETWRCAALNTLTNQGDGDYRAGMVTPILERDRLWDYVRTFERQGVTFLWVWDLSWTARITGMLPALTEAGWRMDAFNFAPMSSWMVWRKGRATIKVVDVRSIWPTSLEQVATWFGEGRRPQPSHDAPDLTWLARARRDCQILTNAVTAYAVWLRGLGLGSLAVTGSAQAWTAWRTRFMTHNILVHDNQELHELERAAMHTGRCEAYWHGSVLGGVVDEWDWTTAHNRIVATENIPVYPVRPVMAGERWENTLDGQEAILLAEVRITTCAPSVPYRTDAGIVWPVGTFTTVLWAPEIRAALDGGATVHLVRGWLYRSAPALKAWADWVDENLSLPEYIVPAWEKAILKRWSNTLIGRFAMRYPKWETLGRMEKESIGSVVCWNLNDDTDYTLMHVGHDVFFQSDWTDPRDHAPAVTSYVMSFMRAKLWRLLSALPPKAALYCDTDSILVRASDRSAMALLSSQEWAKGLRLKRSWDEVTILGPRQIVTDGNARIAGLPKGAQQLSWAQWLGETVESLDLAMQSGTLDAVRSTARTWTITGVDPRRNGPAVGWTRPHVIEEREE